MTESGTVFIPPEQRNGRRPGVFIPPLLIVPFLIYNAVALFTGMDPAVWSTQLFTVPMVSGVPWSLTSGDLLLVLGLACLFFEMLKSTNSGRSSIVEHMLSTVVFVIFLVEFLLVGFAGSSVFFLLMMMALLDVVAGFSISITAAGRDVTMA
jgi:hypothetical protein